MGLLFPWLFSRVSFKNSLSGALLLLPLSLVVLWWLSRPFPAELLAQRASLSPLSTIQKQNIALAAARLDGSVLRPGEVFSFNKTVGPRNIRRGYQPAPSYIGDESPETLGGGICLLSSTLYQLALNAGLKIVARTPHLRPVNTVAPGLDAAIWYGRLDVAFKNDSAQALRLRALVRDNTLSVSFEGKRKFSEVRLQRRVLETPKGLAVSLVRSVRDKASQKISREKISSDFYRL